MRSRRSSRDSTPSTQAEDGDDSDQPTLAASERQLAVAASSQPSLLQSSKSDGNVKKGTGFVPSNEKGVWSRSSSSTGSIAKAATTATATATVIPTTLGKELEEGKEAATTTTTTTKGSKTIRNTTKSTTTTRNTAEQESRLNKEKMEDSRNYRPRSRLRSSWACSIWTLVVTAMSAFALWTIVQSFRERQCDAKGCRMSHMSPIYLKAKDFDTEHTRFASKYNLYLYRENGVDEDYPPKGVPVLFIPGNAGSYRQVRPIAAEAARHYRNVIAADETLAKAGTRNLDFFTVDFNEDITAFHGQTVLDQAEYLNEAVAYILSLYHDSRKSTMDSDLPDPSSVIIFGHSMGGIVARTMLIMPNYRSKSINTIITMSAPHSRPPVSFDRQIVKTYDDINNYWSRSFSEKWANNNPLWHTTLVSIAGGGLDNVVPSDYASISSLVPDTHGFTVYTSTIPDVWLGADHLAILWCDQLMKVVARAMLDIIDVKRAEQTAPRQERMRILKKWFLTGLEEGTQKTLSDTKPTTLLTLGADSQNITSQGQRLVLRHLGESQKPRAYLMPIPPSPGAKFTLMTDQTLSGRNGKLEVLFCSVWPLQAGQSAALFSMNMDLSGDSTGSTRLACKSAADDVIRLPASTKDSQHSFDARTPFSYLEYKFEDLVDENRVNRFEFVAVVDKTTQKNDGWVIAEFSTKDSQIRSDIGLWGLLSDGVHVTLPADRSVVQDINIPSIHSSLFAYKLKVGQQQCSGRQLFTPLVRQYLADPHESKFFVNAKEADVNLHGTAPFLPPALRPNSRRGLSLQIWSDPTCNSPIDISVEIDFMGSLGRPANRYRMALAAFPLLIVALVIRQQFVDYNNFGRFISFAEGMDLFVTRSLPYVLGSLSVIAFTLSFANSEASSFPSSPLEKRSDDHPSTAQNMQFAKNDMLVGLQDPFFWFLAPLCATIAIGIVVVLNYLVLIILNAGCAVSMGIDRLLGRGPEKRGGAVTPTFSTSSPRRRIIVTGFLLLFVATIVPYQFAYLVACIIQLLTCIRALKFAKENSASTSSPAWDFYNYSHSVLVIMLWILPINLPVLVVWHHNLAVHWLTPFSSHHNLLSIMPFILLVETATTGNMIPRVVTRSKHITNLLLIAIAAYSAMYGVTYAYRLHHLVNILAAWLVVIHFSQTRPTMARVVEILTAEEAEEGGVAAVVGKKRVL
ncbi:PGAP1-like protein-domain-containing protein [Pyronema omphalodes]|nr:PGAP1-like protein-domain-containing protein [Pyronema omphalodes]